MLGLYNAMKKQLAIQRPKLIIKEYQGTGEHSQVTNCQGNVEVKNRKQVHERFLMNDCKKKKKNTELGIRFNTNWENLYTVQNYK